MKKIRIFGIIIMVMALLVCLAGCGETEVLVVEETESLFIAEDIPQYTVYFEGGDSATGTAPSSITLESGESFVVPENTFAKSGYEFYAYWTGWEYISPGDTYVMKSQDMHFIACWTVVYTASSSSSSSGGGGGGGSSSSSSTTTTTTTTTTQQLESPEISYDSGVLSWDAIDDADFYTIKIGDVSYIETEETSLDIVILSTNDSEDITVFANITDSESYTDSDASNSVSIDTAEIIEGVMSANGTYLIVACDYEYSDGNLEINSTSEILYLVGGSIAVTAGDLTVYAPYASLYQEIEVSVFGTLYLTVSDNTYIQNNALKASTIVVQSGKILQNNEIETDSIDVTSEGAYYAISEEAEVSAIPTLVIADTDSIVVDVDLPLTLEIDIGEIGDEATTIDLSNIASSQIEIQGDAPTTVILSETIETEITNNTGDTFQVKSWQGTTGLEDGETVTAYVKPNIEYLQTDLVWGGNIGSDFSTLGVTSTVTCWYDTGDIVDLDVVWDEDSYDANVSSQTIYGTVDGVDDPISLTILLINARNTQSTNASSNSYVISEEIDIPDIIGTTYQASEADEVAGIIDLSNSYIVGGDSNFIWSLAENSISAVVENNIATGTVAIYGYFSEDSEYNSCSISEDLTNYSYSEEEGRIKIEITVSHDLSALSYTPPDVAGATNYAFNSLVLIDQEYTVDNGGDTVGNAFKTDGYIAYQELYISLLEAFEAMHNGESLNTAYLADFAVMTTGQNDIVDNNTANTNIDIAMQSIISGSETYYYLNFYIDPDYYTSYEVNMVIELIRLDHTRFYWLNNYCVGITKQSASGSTTIGYTPCVFSEFFDGSNEDYSIASMDELLKEQVEYFQTLTQYCMTDLEKIAIVHSEMLGMVEYDSSVVTNEKYTYTSNNIIGILDENSTTNTVCEGYAMAFSYIMNELGVNTITVVGTCANDAISGHAWNIFEIDGAWYNLDLTWNDGTSLANYTNTFLGLNNSVFVNGGIVMWLDSSVGGIQIGSYHINYSSTIYNNSVLYICYDLPNAGSSLTLFNTEYIMLDSGQLLYTAEAKEEVVVGDSQDTYASVYTTISYNVLSEFNPSTQQGGVRFVTEEIMLTVE